MPYYPKTQYTKAKSAGPGEFVVKDTQEYYKGLFVKTSNNKYFGGSTPMDTGVELEKVKDSQLGLDEGIPVLVGVLAGAAKGFFNKILTNSDKQKGVTKRYFVQDRNTNKIVETDKTTYQQTKNTIMSRSFAEVDWIVKGPAEDKTFGAYKYEGAESKNRKAIQAIEKQLPGISAYITDYTFLVEEPQVVDKQALTTQSFTETDPTIQLDNSRKANFDTRK